MNHLKLAVTVLEDMFYNHESRFEDPLIVANEKFEHLTKAQELIEKMNVLGNIEYSMNMYSNHYKPRYLSKNQKELFEKSQSVLEKYRGKVVDAIDGYEVLASYLNDAIAGTILNKNIDFPKDNYDKKLKELNDSVKSLFVSLKEASNSFTETLLQNDWERVSFPYNSQTPKALTKEEVFLLVERFDGFVDEYVFYGKSGGIPDYNCVFHSNFERLEFFKLLYTDMSEEDIKDMYE